MCNVLPNVVGGDILFACGITMIVYEHTRILCDKIELISNEKGGIFQHSMHQNDKSALNVLQQCATERIVQHNNNNTLDILPQEKLHAVSINDNDNNLDATIGGAPGNHQKVNSKLAYCLWKSSHEQILSKNENQINIKEIIPIVLQNAFVVLWNNLIVVWIAL